MNTVTLSVISRGSNEVGTIPAQAGLKTNKGVIDRVTPSGTIFFEDGRRTRSTNGLNVTHTEARRHGYPEGEGCNRLRAVTIRRNGELIVA